MFQTILRSFRATDAPPTAVNPEAVAAFDAALQVLDTDPYLMVADTRLRLVSVFDDLKYDRADMDMMSGPMRQRVEVKLRPLGVRQEAGSAFVHQASGVRLLMPKFRALGALPFDAVRDTPRGPQDYYILTPTQTACQFIDHYPVDDAVAAIKALVIRHPVNLLRIADALDKSARHQAFAKAIGHLMYVQRVAVTSEPLCRRRALR